MDIRSIASRQYRSVVIIAALASAFSGHGVAGAEPHVSQPAAHEALLKNHQHGDKRSIRVREDTARHRLWVLGLDQVYVYDTRTLALLGQVQLPRRSADCR